MLPLSCSDMPSLRNNTLSSLNAFPRADPRRKRHTQDVSKLLGGKAGAGTATHHRNRRIASAPAIAAASPKNNTK